MKRAIFLVGFNNWGKTRTIYNLFRRSRFYVGSAYSIPWSIRRSRFCRRQTMIILSLGSFEK
jgi:hypothetical protein